MAFHVPSFTFNSYDFYISPLHDPFISIYIAYEFHDDKPYGFP